MPGIRWIGKRCPDAVAGEGDLPRPLRLGEEDRHAGHHPLEGALHGPDPDVEPGVLPQNDVMLEEDGHGPVQPGMQHGHKLTLDPVADPGSLPILELSGEQLWRRLHGVLLLDGRCPARMTLSIGVPCWRVCIWAKNLLFEGPARIARLGSLDALSARCKRVAEIRFAASGMSDRMAGKGGTCRHSLWIGATAGCRRFPRSTDSTRLSYSDGDGACSS